MGGMARGSKLMNSTNCRQTVGVVDQTTQPTLARPCVQHFCTVRWSGDETTKDGRQRDTLLNLQYATHVMSWGVPRKLIELTSLKMLPEHPDVSKRFGRMIVCACKRRERRDRLGLLSDEIKSLLKEASHS